MANIAMRYGQAGKTGRGNTYTETLLWSRASETGAFTSTLSSPASGFKYLRISVQPFSSSNPSFDVIVNCENIADMDSSVTNTGRIALGARGSSYYYARYGSFNSAYTQISWTTSYRAGSSTTNAGYVLPLAIYGIS